MSGDATRGREDSTGLSDVREGSIEEKATGRILTEQVLARWQTVGVLVVLAVTSYGLYAIDGRLSKDALVFAVITVLLAVYLLMTLRSDLELE